MTSSTAGGSAHGATIRTEPFEFTELRRRIGAVVDLCLEGLSARPNVTGIVNIDTIWPTDVLDALGVDYGPGSELALRLEKE